MTALDSLPIAKRSDYDARLDRELENWPGVTWVRRVGRKHARVILTFNGETRFVPYSLRPSDGVRGVHHHLTDVKAQLRDMGAVRKAQRRAAGTKRQPAKPVRITVALEPMTVKPDPWAKLRELYPEEAARPDGVILLPQKPSWIGRLIGWLAKPWRTAA